MAEPKVITAEDVIKELDALDNQDEPVIDKPVVVDPAKPVVVDPALAPKATPPALTGNPLLDEMWSMAERGVKKHYPDLDDEDREMLRSAAKDSPSRYEELAERMQSKLSARPKPKVETEAERLAREIFDGGHPGGDPATVRVVQPTPNDKVTAAVKVGDGKGILRGLTEVVEKEKLWERGIRIGE